MPSRLLLRALVQIACVPHGSDGGPVVVCRLGSVRPASSVRSRPGLPLATRSMERGLAPVSSRTKRYNLRVTPMEDWGRFVVPDRSVAYPRSAHTAQRSCTPLRLNQDVSCRAARSGGRGACVDALGLNPEVGHLLFVTRYSAQLRRSGCRPHCGDGSSSLVACAQKRSAARIASASGCRSQRPLARSLCELRASGRYGRYIRLTGTGRSQGQGGRAGSSV